MTRNASYFGTFGAIAHYGHAGFLISTPSTPEPKPFTASGATHRDDKNAHKKKHVSSLSLVVEPSKVRFMLTQNSKPKTPTKPLNPKNSTSLYNPFFKPVPKTRRSRFVKGPPKLHMFKPECRAVDNPHPTTL